MAESSTHINYSFEDIQRYLQGKMTAAEMHDVEKVALQDPFLADAIEGFSETDFTKANQHLNEINAALLKEKEESKIISFNKKTKWLNVAVLIIVLAGIGIIISYFFNSSAHQQTQIAQVKNDRQKDSIQHQPETTKLSTSPVVTDTTKLIAENKPFIKSKKIVSQKHQSEEIAIADKNLKDDKNVTANIETAPAQLSQNNISLMMDSANYDLKTSKTDNTDSIQYILAGKANGVSLLPSTFSGKVVDENSKPVAGALIQSADKKDAVVTDLNGNFDLQKNDTALNVTASTVGYDIRTAKLKSGTNPPIILKGTNSNLNDVVVVGYSNVKQRKALPDSAMPLGGWQNFNKYVVSQLKADSTMQDNFYNDDLVELEFMIDDSGSPYNIKVVKSFDDKKDSQAIDILKGGPRWTKFRKNKQTRVAISFKPR